MYVPTRYFNVPHAEFDSNARHCISYYIFGKNAGWGKLEIGWQVCTTNVLPFRFALLYPSFLFLTPFPFWFIFELFLFPFHFLSPFVKGYVSSFG
jgi:hypothetical protein